MGRLPYREAVMPLLSLDAEVVYFHEGNRFTEKLDKIFDKRMKLPADSCLYQIIVPKAQIKWQYQNRLTESVTVDYPILHLHGMGVGSRLTVALSGYSNFPVHVVLDSADIEDVSNLRTMLLERFEKMVKADDRSGEAYRKHLLSLSIDEMLKKVIL
jgi:aromatic ring-cleaving dioxygenase